MHQMIQETLDLVGLSVTPQQISSFETYQQELLVWNQRVNLTAISDPGEVRVKHFLDSLSCLLAMQGTPMQKVIDVGSGAGFPGLPLKIIYPEMQLTLVESVRKKTKFLQHIVQELKLENVQVLSTRAEQVGQQTDHRQKYDWAISRSVAALPVLVEYLLPLVKVGGYILAQKGNNIEQELQMAQPALQLLHAEFKELIPVQLPGDIGARNLVIIRKLEDTPPQYPRRDGVPKKKPL